MLIGGRFGGSGNTLRRAVSLASGVVPGVTGAGAAMDGPAGAAAVVPIGRGKGVFVAGGRGGGTALGDDGANVRDVGTLEIGGRGIATVPGFDSSGAEVWGGSDAGGREGKLIRTVSSSCGRASPSRGGTIIRTVSFFGSLASAMIRLKCGIRRLPEIFAVVTGELT